ncbi:MAG: sulfatase-like hydrolase/transferase, partial [Fuerstiella sp.]
MTFRLLFIFLPLICSPALTFAQIQRPNVVMIIADQLRYESCGYAGDEKAITPNIDRLAATGISFDNYVVNTPVCAATRATLWTGKYASTHGMVVNELRLNPNHDTLGHLLT